MDFYLCYEVQFSFQGEEHTYFVHPDINPSVTKGRYLFQFDYLEDRIDIYEEDQNGYYVKYSDVDATFERTHSACGHFAAKEHQRLLDRLVQVKKIQKDLEEGKLPKDEWYHRGLLHKEDGPAIKE